MSNLADLLSLALNVVFVFATVSFVATSATDGISAALQWRENLLLRGVKDLLNDPMFTGLARAIYNNMGVNPRASGTAETEAQLRYKPAAINSSAFGVALLEVLHIVPSSSAPPDMARVDEGVELRARMDNAISNATRIIEASVANEKARLELTQLAVNMLLRHNGNRQQMEAAVATWFEFGMAHVGDSFRGRTQLSNFAIAFLIAFLLDLKPLPVGGFNEILGVKAEGASGTAIAGYIPLVIGIFEWSVVAASTLLGAQFWFSVLKSLKGASGTNPTEAKEVPPSSGGSGAALPGASPTPPSTTGTGNGPPQPPPGGANPSPP